MFFDHSEGFNMNKKTIDKANCLLGEKIKTSAIRKEVYSQLYPLFTQEDDNEYSTNECDNLIFSSFEQFRSQARRLNDKEVNSQKNSLNLKLTANSILTINIFAALDIDCKTFIENLTGKIDIEEQKYEREFNNEYDNILEKLDKIEYFISNQRVETISMNKRFEFLYNYFNMLSSIFNNCPDNIDMWLYLFAQKGTNYLPRQIIQRKLIKKLDKVNSNSFDLNLTLYSMYLTLVLTSDYFGKLLNKAESYNDKTVTKIMHVRNPTCWCLDKKKKEILRSIYQELTTFEKYIYEFCLLCLKHSDSPIRGRETINDCKDFLKKIINAILEILNFESSMKNLFQNHKKQHLFDMLKQTDVVSPLIVNSIISEKFVKTIKTISSEIDKIMDEIKANEIETQIELSRLQQEAVDFVWNTWREKETPQKRRAPIIALDMGTGKTRASCAIIKDCLVKEKCITSYVLIIVPAGLINPWEEELKNNFNIQCITLRNTSRKKHFHNGKLFYTKGDCILISYDTIINDFDFFIKDPPSLIVYDELQTINNSNPIQNKCVRLAKLNSECSYIFALTGTPAQNSTMDFFVNYCFFHNHSLLQKFAYKKPLSEQMWDTDNEFKKVKQRLTNYNYYFFGKDSPSILIARYIIPIRIEAQHLKNYRKMVDYNEKNQHILAKYLLCPPCFNTNQRLRNLEISTDIQSSKMKFVRGLIKNIPSEEKIVIFSYYVDPLKELQKLLTEYKPILIIGLNNQIDENDTQEKVAKFNQNPDNRVLLSTIKKSGTGLNFQAANHLIILDMWWNPMAIFQSMHRIIRKSQERNVNIYFPIYFEQDENNVKILDAEVNLYNTMLNKVKNYNTFLSEINCEKGTRDFPCQVVNELLDFDQSSEICIENLHDSIDKKDFLKINSFLPVDSSNNYIYHKLVKMNNHRKFGIQIIDE